MQSLEGRKTRRTLQFARWGYLITYSGSLRHSVCDRFPRRRRRHRSGVRAKQLQSRLVKRASSFLPSRVSLSRLLLRSMNPAQPARENPVDVEVSMVSRSFYSWLTGRLSMLT